LSIRLPIISPGTTRYRPDLQSGWRNLGNRSDVDEYLRRQAMSAQDYQRFLKSLREEFPTSRSWWCAFV
jgi:hypothetical protein